MLRSVSKILIVYFKTYVETNERPNNVQNPPRTSAFTPPGQSFSSASSETGSDDTVEERKRPVNKDQGN